MTEIEIKMNILKTILCRFYNSIEGINLSTFYIIVFISVYFLIKYVKNNYTCTIILIVLNIINIKLIKNYFTVHDYVVVTNEYTIPVFALVIFLFIFLVYFFTFYFRLNLIFITKLLFLSILIILMLWFISLLVFSVTKAPATDIFLIPGIMKIERFLDKISLHAYAINHVKNANLNLLPDEIDFLVRDSMGYEYLESRLDHFEQGKIEVLERRRLEAERKLASQVDYSAFSIALGVGAFFLTLGVSMGVAFAISSLIN